jgi:hypothetical protein
VHGPIQNEFFFFVFRFAQAIIVSMFKTLPNMTSLTILLLVYMFIAAVAGMQLLGNQIPYTHRSNYRDFGVAMIT